MNKDKTRIIHTGLYSNVAKEIISSVIAQQSDGKWENSPSMEKYWKFVDCVRAADNEVLIEVSTEPYKYEAWSYHNKHICNGFYYMDEAKVKQKFAGWIKCIAKDEMKDENAGNQWKRNSGMKLDYLNYYENVTAADAYFVYEMLLGRDNVDKYDEGTVQKVLGKKLSEEATKANEEKAKKIEQLIYDRDQIIKQLKEKKEAAIKEIEAKYAKDWQEKIDLYKKMIDEVKAA